MADESTLEERRRIWGQVAAGYDSSPNDGPMGRLTDWIVARADPQPGQVVLDLATGGGEVGHRVARDVGPGCRVICSDFAPEMLAVARRIGTERGLENVEYRVIDAEQMELDDDSVDVIVCRAGLMVMPDPGAALAESRRVLRPGGVLAAAVFTTPAANPWVVTPLAVFVELGFVARPDPSGPGMFALGDPEHLRGLATQAGFVDVATAEIDFAFAWPDEAAVWRVVAEVNARLKPVVAALDPDERDTARRAVMDAFEPYRLPDGSFEVPAQGLGLVAG